MSSNISVPKELRLNSDSKKEARGNEPLFKN